jgi:SAM-dependent methyltransferase
LVVDGTLAGFGTGALDLILAAFAFDNIPTDQQKTSALRELRRLLAPGGRLVVVVSSPAIYWHEWASFSTRDYPANRSARDGDSVRIVMLDVPDRRPVIDIVCSDTHYRELFEAVGLCVVDTVRPLATGSESLQWVNETRIPPWTIYVLGAV